MKHKSGFTLVEMMVALAIIVIIGATAAPAINSYLQARGVKNAADSLFMKMHKYQRICKKRRVRANFSFNDPVPNQYTVVLTDPAIGVVGSHTVDVTRHIGGVQFTGATVPQIEFSIDGLCPGGLSGPAVLTNQGNTHSYRVRTTMAGGISMHKWDPFIGRWVSSN